MIKTVFKQATKVLKGKLNKLELGEKLAKHPNYLEKAKEIWTMINEDLRISNTVGNKFVSKVEKFEKALFTKFPELTKADVIKIKQSIVEEFNTGKDAVISKVDALKNLKDLNTQLQDENTKLKNELSKFQSVDIENTDIEAHEISTTNTTDVE